MPAGRGRKRKLPKGSEIASSVSLKKSSSSCQAKVDSEALTIKKETINPYEKIVTEVPTIQEELSKRAISESDKINHGSANGSPNSRNDLTSITVQLESKFPSSLEVVKDNQINTQSFEKLNNQLKLMIKEEVQAEEGEVIASTQPANFVSEKKGCVSDKFLSSSQPAPLSTKPKDLNFRSKKASKRFKIPLKKLKLLLNKSKLAPQTVIQNEDVKDRLCDLLREPNAEPSLDCIVLSGNPLQNSPRNSHGMDKVSPSLSPRSNPVSNSSNVLVLKNSNLTDGFEPLGKQLGPDVESKTPSDHASNNSTDDNIGIAFKAKGLGLDVEEKPSKDSLDVTSNELQSTQVEMGRHLLTGNANVNSVNNSCGFEVAKDLYVKESNQPTDSTNDEDQISTTRECTANADEFQDNAIFSHEIETSNDSRSHQVENCRKVCTIQDITGSIQSQGFTMSDSDLSRNDKLAEYDSDGESEFYKTPCNSPILFEGKNIRSSKITQQNGSEEYDSINQTKESIESKFVECSHGNSNGLSSEAKHKQSPGPCQQPGEDHHKEVSQIHANDIETNTVHTGEQPVQNGDSNHEDSLVNQKSSKLAQENTSLTERSQCFDSEKSSGENQGTVTNVDHSESRRKEREGGKNIQKNESETNILSLKHDVNVAATKKQSDLDQADSDNLRPASDKKDQGSLVFNSSSDSTVHGVSVLKPESGKTGHGVSAADDPGEFIGQKDINELALVPDSENCGNISNLGIPTKSSSANYGNKALPMSATVKGAPDLDLVLCDMQSSANDMDFCDFETQNFCGDIEDSEINDMSMFEEEQNFQSCQASAEEEVEKRRSEGASLLQSIMKDLVSINRQMLGMKRQMDMVSRSLSKTSTSRLDTDNQRGRSKSRIGKGPEL